MGWLDVRSHPLGIDSDAIRITMYNPQPIEVTTKIDQTANRFWAPYFLMGIYLSSLPMPA